PVLLERAVRSFLAQSYGDFQIVVHDNASGDETAEVVARLNAEDARVRYHCNAENIGSIPNLIQALEQVDTPYFCILSDDDFVLPVFFSSAMAAHEKYPDLVFSATAVLEANEQGQVNSVHDLGG